MVEAEDGGRRSEVGDHITDIRGQMTEGREKNAKSEVGNSSSDR